MNQAEQQWWDEFNEKLGAYVDAWCQGRGTSRLYDKLTYFIADALDHDAFTHSKR